MNRLNTALLQQLVQASNRKHLDKREVAVTEVKFLTFLALKIKEHEEVIKEIIRQNIGQHTPAALV